MTDPIKSAAADVREAAHTLAQFHAWLSLELPKVCESLRFLDKAL